MKKEQVVEFVKDANLFSLQNMKFSIEKQVSQFGPSEETTFALLVITNAIESKKLEVPKTLDDLHQIIISALDEYKDASEFKRSWMVAVQVNAKCNLNLQS